MSADATELPVVIVGAGLAGMRCAQVLSNAGVAVILFEKQSRVGGRVQTDEVDWFFLDRGFQVLLTGYPDAREALDFDGLDLQDFAPGAIVRIGGRFHTISDPVREPATLLSTLKAPVGSLADKMKMLPMKSRLSRMLLSEIFEREELTTLEALRDRWRFSPSMIESFFRPFFGGILLDRSLQGSSRMMEFVFKMFSVGSAALPAEGMGKISDQMASRLSSVDIRPGTSVRTVGSDSVVLDDGSSIAARAVVIAVEGPEADRLLGENGSHVYVGTHCHYFATEHAPVSEKLLVLNGEGAGPINNLAVITNVAPAYSATQEALISVTVLDDPTSVSSVELETDVRSQLTDWFGPVVQHWRHIRSYHIPAALPDQRPPFLSPPEKPVRVRPSVYRCGDYVDTASINGALRSGRRAADAVIKDLSGAA